MIAGVFIDSWKLDTFKKVLDEVGFTYTEHPGFDDKTKLLKVECVSAAHLAPTIRKAQAACGN